MIARDPRATWPYVLERDRSLPKEQQTVFRLKHLSLAQEHAILDSVSRDPISGLAVRQAVGTEHLRTLRMGLVGWENFPCSDGSQLTYEAGPLGGAKDELLFRIPLRDREELANAIELEIAFDPDTTGKS